MIFGISASTRTSVRALDRRLLRLDEGLGGVGGRVAGLDGRLAEGNEALGRIEELLRTRLPAA
jgi:hypothetical protein